MTTLNEQLAALLVAEHAFAPATPGFVGATVDRPGAGRGERIPLRHGFRTEAGAVSGPPSPGLEACIARMDDDLAAAARLSENPAASRSSDDPAASRSSDDPAAGTPARGAVRVALEAGLDGGGPLGLSRRWALAHTLAPVLAAAFANTPGPTGWRSTRLARHRELPVLRAVRDPRKAWAAYVLEQPGPRDSLDALARHVDTVRPPVAARGHLEFDVADAQPGEGWRVVVAVTAVLLDDPRAAAAAEQITAPLAAEPRLWERAARDALSDPVLAAVARECFVEAYGTLARHGVSRDLRDQVAEFAERYVMRGRCPADERLRPVPR
ncbi:glutamate-cysteine ligase family protein [Paractinoplanes bogorensis]|uniref:glutamate-cysteine ligase family protein n=1 Tax=Paractinoplanes bogorensis TaxID=1610840 RepID=UPI0027DFA235|nr:glutamate-cysteine ligase family protein [Actinoplanes bogorensis]